MPMMIVLKQTRENIVAALLMLVITSLFISRALLSMSMAVFCITALALYATPQKVNRTALFFIIGFGLLFMVPFLSGFWSSDTAEWWRRCVVKLPLLLLPVVFSYYKPGGNTVFTVVLLFVFFVTCSTLYSIYEYVLGVDAIEAGYLRAKVMPVLPGNDHIRFSWLTVIAIIMIIYLQREIARRSFRIISLIILGWLVIFLHILAAKTGLVLLYSTAIVLLLYYVIQTNRKKLLFLLLLLPLLPFMAYHTVPTFKKRVEYALYDFQHYSQQNYKEGLSDGMRLTSVKAGMDIWKENFVAGTGFGDVEQAAANWYTINTPEIKPYERILPSSQPLIYAAGTGLGGLVFFMAALLLPFTLKGLRRNVYFMAFYIPALVTFIFEIHLESQYGCFIFCFFALWMGLVTTRVKSE
jgi:O-antigen ligase